MDNWDESKRKFIEKLENTNNFFNEIFDKDKNGMVIGLEEAGQLRKLQERNAKILKKLKNKEFTVAVVGLEKAGKSTVGNALIKLIVLPEYTERCTYTTTEIRAGDKDEAIISFYSPDKFNTNFKQMMQVVQYNGEANFITTNLDAFNNYWSAVRNDDSKQMLFNAYDGNTVEDIRSIIKGKDVLRFLLGKHPQTFELGDNSEYARKEMNLYITGIQGYNDDGSVIRSPHPYAVENVVIHSTHLNEMSHIVLYDVPGFDSPTEMHKRQTEEMLSKADAIILVTNVGDRPNLTGTQLNMLRKVRDEDGIKLSEKAFVFGNKLDSAGNEQRARDNMAVLRNEAVNKYQITSSERIVCGSAKAYLEKNEMFSEDELRRGRVNADKTLAEWNMSDGIDELNQKMQQYYDNDRFNVLKKRAEKTLVDTEQFLRKILDKYTPDVLERLENGGEYLLEIKDKLNSFVREASKISSKYQEQIIREKPFSKELIDNIETIYPLMNEFTEMIEDVENEGAIDTAGNYLVTRVNSTVRNRLQTQFMKNIVEKAAGITDQKDEEINDELVTKFLEIIGMSPNSQYREELETSVRELFKSLVIKNGAKCYFNPLVERFSTGLVETLILSPFATEDRYKKVMMSLPELLSLAVYYTMRNIEDTPEISDDPNERLKFFAKILLHEDVEPLVEDYSGNEQLLRSYFEENGHLLTDGTIFSIDDLPLVSWSILLGRAGFNFTELPQKMTRAFEANFYRGNWSQLSKEDRIRLLEKVVTAYCKSGAGNQSTSTVSTNLTQRIKELHELSKKLNTLQTKEDMIELLNADIEILRDVTVNSVIKATGLEIAFIAVVTKNINLIRENLTYNPEGVKKFNDWIQANVRKIKESEFAAIEQDNMNSQARKMIISSIRQALDKLD